MFGKRDAKLEQDKKDQQAIIDGLEKKIEDLKSDKVTLKEDVDEWLADVTI